MNEDASAPGSINPANGEALPPVEPTPVEEVKQAVARSRKAQTAWAARPLKERIDLVKAAARAAVEQAQEGARIVSMETGKSEAESLLTEVSGAYMYVVKAIPTAKKALKTEKAAISFIEMPGKSAVIEAVPRGVVGIIAPWNYPAGNFFKSLFPALIAGNGVVMKPSEFTPRTGQWLAERVQSILPEGLVQVVQGGGEVGAAVLESGVDSIVFTGSVPTGRKVAARAAELLIPCSVELGGKDAAIVLADCNLERTVVGIAQWAMHNCGHNCAGIERVYVEAAIADEFVERLGKVVSKLRVAKGDDEFSDLGPVQNETQLSIVEEHVEDAKEHGAKVVCGGQRTGVGLGYEPTVLDQCKQDMKVVRDETFGPVLAVVRVADADQAVELANDSRYGLNGSVWTSDIRRGQELARRLDVGVALVNNHAITGSMPNLPWSGVRETGPGVASSHYAYSSFVRRRVLFTDRNKKPDPWWVPANADSKSLAEAVIAHSLGSLAAVLTMVGLLGKRVKAIRQLASGD